MTPCIYLYIQHWSDASIIAYLDKISVVCPLSTQYDLLDGFIEVIETLSTLFNVNQGF